MLVFFCHICHELVDIYVLLTYVSSKLDLVCYPLIQKANAIILSDAHSLTCFRIIYNMFCKTFLILFLKVLL